MEKDRGRLYLAAEKREVCVGMRRHLGFERGVLILSALVIAAMAGIFLLSGHRQEGWWVTTQRWDSESEADSVQDDWPDSLLEGEIIDLNTADFDQLIRLPGIGEKRAQAILDWRQEHGSFRTTEQLLEVQGIGRDTLAKISAYVTTGNIS